MRNLREALRRPSAVVLLASLVSSVCPAVAFAQTDEQRSAARALATDGASAFKEGRFKDAVDMFTRAESLVHALPHLLYLARSYEKLGQLVKAREAYLKIIKETLPANAPQAFQDAKTSAEQEVSSIEPRLASLAVKLEGAEQAKDPAVLVDGTQVPQVLVGIAQPIDPGEHKIEAGAEGFRADPQKLRLGEGEKQVVTMKLIADPKAKALIATAPPPAAAAPAQTTGNANSGSPTTDQGAAQPEDKSGLRIASYVAFGVGVVGIAGGTFFTLQSASKRKDADDKYAGCKGTAACDANNDPLSKEIDGLDQDAKSAKTLGIVGFVVGGVGLVTGTVLFVMSSGGSSEKTASIQPWVGLDSAGLRGTF